MPDKTATLRFAPVFRLKRTFYLPQNALGSGNLVGAHHQQGIAHIEHRIMQQHIEQRIFLKESRGKVFQVFNQAVIGLRPVHGEVVAVFIALGGVGEITAIGAVGNYKQLQVLIQRMFAVKALLL